MWKKHYKVMFTDFKVKKIKWESKVLSSIQAISGFLPHNSGHTNDFALDVDFIKK